MNKSEIKAEILSMLGRRAHSPTTNGVHGAVRHAHQIDIDDALAELVRENKIRCVNGFWVRLDRLMRDNRKPRGPKKLDPESAEARTLPLAFYGGGEKR